MQQSASTLQAPSGCAQVALRHVQVEAPGKISVQPQTPEQQSKPTAQFVLTARQGAGRHKPTSQIPVQHCEGLVQPVPAG
jgi:hypothetical protein